MSHLAPQRVVPQRLDLDTVNRGAWRRPATVRQYDSPTASSRWWSFPSTASAEQKRELAAAGFQAEIVLDNVQGRPVADDADTRGISWFHYVARKMR